MSTRNEKIIFIKNEIAENRILDAIRLLMEISQEEKDFNDRLIIISNQYREVENKKKRGIDTNENIQLEKNKIINSLIQLTHEIDEFHAENISFHNINNGLEMIEIESEMVSVRFKVFRTGKVYLVKDVSLNMLTKEFKNELIKFSMKDYFEIPELEKTIEFDLMKLGEEHALTDKLSLNENGIKENDIVFLKRSFRYGERIK